MPRETWATNLSRLLAVHGLEKGQAAQLTGGTPQALSEWLTSKTTPRTDKLIEVERLFEVPALRLMEADFGDLLANELSDRERYERVEQKIAGAGFELSAGAHGGVVLDIQGTGRKKGRARVDKARKSKNG